MSGFVLSNEPKAEKKIDESHTMKVAIFLFFSCFRSVPRKTSVSWTRRGNPMTRWAREYVQVK